MPKLQLEPFPLPAPLRVACQNPGACQAFGHWVQARGKSFGFRSPAVSKSDSSDRVGLCGLKNKAGASVLHTHTDGFDPGLVREATAWSLGVLPGTSEKSYDWLWHVCLV